MNRRAFLAATGCAVAALSGCTSDQSAGNASGGNGTTAQVSFDVPAIDSHRIRTRVTCDGENVSPELIVLEAAAPIQSLAVVMTDADANDYVHWTMWDVPYPIEEIPEDVRKQPQVQLTEVETEEGESPTVSQGLNSAGEVGYTGPCPPEGEEHVYKFELFGLPEPLAVEPGAEPGVIQDAVREQSVGQTALTGTYGSDE